MIIQVLRQERISFTNSGSLSDVSQASLKVPSLADSTSDCEQAVLKKKLKKKTPVPSIYSINFYAHNLVVFFQLV